MASKKVTCDCHKCGGTGYIAAFAHIANGDCFTCKGTGKVTYRPSKQNVQPLSDAAAKAIDTITNGDLSGLSFSQLSSLRKSAHWHYPQAPNLKQVWMERGEAYFQAAQELHLSENYYGL